MIETTATVVAVDPAKGRATVEIQRQSGCGRCGESQPCGANVMQKIWPKRPELLEITSDSPLFINDTVVLGLREDILVRGTFAIYAVPLSLFIGFTLLGGVVAEQLNMQSVDGFSVGFGVIGLFFGVFWLKRYSQTVKKDLRYQPQVLRTLHSAYSATLLKKASRNL